MDACNWFCPPDGFPFLEVNFLIRNKTTVRKALFRILNYYLEAELGPDDNDPGGTSTVRILMITKIYRSWAI